MNHQTLRARRLVRVVALLLGLALALSACGGSAQTTDGDGRTPSAEAGGEPLTIVATTTILGDVASEVGGDGAEVTALMPPGSDPHNFEPSAQQLAQMQEADLIVANGGGLEAQLQSAVDEAERAGVPVFHAVDHVDTLTFDEAEHADAEEPAGENRSDGAHDDEHVDAGHSDGEHEHGSVDPHFWSDPTRTAAVARALGEETAALAANDAGVEARAGTYAQRLEDLDAEVRSMLSTVPEEQRTLVTNHESFGYFADHYGFEVVGTVIPSVSTGAEPSAQDLEELVTTVNEQQVRAIFAENTAPDQLAQTLAQEVGSDVQVVELYSDSLGEEGSEAPTYIDMVRVNAQRVSDALTD